MQQHAILIVDDEKSVLKVIHRVLRNEPYTLLMAVSAKEGLKILKGREVSLVVSDYNMPSMSGLDFLQTVRAQYSQILTIMLTGQAELQIAVRAINEAGVYKFIQKPWNNADLKITIKRALESIDLVSERDKLLQKVKSRDAILQDLEKKFPGITKVERDEEGYMLLS